MPSKKNSEIQNNEYQTFSDALVKVLKVTHIDMRRALKEQKEKKLTVKQASSLGHVSSEKD